MPTFIVLRVDDDDQADDLIRDMAEFPDHDLLSPCLEHPVHAVVVKATRDGKTMAPTGMQSGCPRCGAEIAVGESVVYEGRHAQIPVHERCIPGLRLATR